MHTSKSYQPPDGTLPTGANGDQPRSRGRWALTGFFIAAAAPLAFGIYGMHQHHLYIVTLGPNEVACGMGAIGSLAMMFVIGPFCGAIGTGAGWIASGIHWWSRVENKG